MMTKSKVAAAIAAFAGGAATLTMGAGVTGSDAEAQPQAAFCAKATECMNQSLSGMAAQPGSAYRGGGNKMYSIE